MVDSDAHMPRVRVDICVAEDDEDIRSFLMVILDRAGYRAVDHDDGQGVWDAIGNGRLAALYLLDVRMPVMGGIELTRRIRALPDAGTSRILLMSADAQPSDIETGLAAGADAYLPKPFSRRELLSIIEGLINPDDPPEET